MSDRLEIFDSLGQVRPLNSFTTAELEKLTPEKRELFDKLAAAMKACEEVEQAHANTEKAVRVAVKELDDAHARHRKDHPPTTFYREWRRIVLGEK